MDSKMLAIFSVIFFIGIAHASPSPKPDAAFLAPVVAAPPAAVVTATSSQFFNRNFNGIAAAPLVAAPAVAAPVASPYTAAYAYPYAAAPYITYV